MGLAHHLKSLSLVLDGYLHWASGSSTTTMFLLLGFYFKRTDILEAQI